MGSFRVKAWSVFDFPDLKGVKLVVEKKLWSWKCRHVTVIYVTFRKLRPMEVDRFRVGIKKLKVIVKSGDNKSLIMVFAGYLEIYAYLKTTNADESQLLL